ncbi:MAG: flagellar FliJ family protein [Candidatus Delongbacteria bacterium]|nr:flagellar FliJ family protein [Candidatus Delongbacteria bacterium]MBN2833874.1 flagellar FliJ family protein [Candidatus Delongbacteria bacterium]
MKYVFRLESLLKVKKMEEDLQQKKVQIAEVDYLKVVAKQRQLFDERKTSIDDLKKYKVFNSRTYMISMNYVSEINRRIEANNKTLREKEKVLNKEKSFLISISMDRMMLEKLKEKQMEDYRKQEDMKEQKLMDEMGIRNYNNSLTGY